MRVFVRQPRSGFASCRLEFIPRAKKSTSFGKQTVRLLLTAMLFLSPVLVGQNIQVAKTRHLSAPAQRFHSNLDFLERNAKCHPVQRRSTQMTADHVKAWFHEGSYKLHDGGHHVV